MRGGTQRLNPVVRRGGLGFFILSTDITITCDTFCQGATVAIRHEAVTRRFSTTGLNANRSLPDTRHLLNSIILPYRGGVVATWLLVRSVPAASQCWNKQLHQTFDFVKKNTNSPSHLVDSRWTAALHFHPSVFRAVCLLFVASQQHDPLFWRLLCRTSPKPHTPWLLRWSGSPGLLLFR